MSRLAKLDYFGTILFGGIHAASSLYWGLGGDALVETVGQGAAEWKQDSPLLVPIVLIPLGLAKATAVAVPILNSQGRLPWPRLVRAASWLGAAGLVLYGGAYATLSWLSLSGRLGEVEDRVGLLGHAYLWDPLFVAWGLSLVLALANDPFSERHEHT